jgi:purine-binding chemotaxis protein CheW
LQWKNLQIGIVVHQVNEVLELNEAVIKVDAEYHFIGDINTAFIAGVAKVDPESVLLLEPSY